MTTNPWESKDWRKQIAATLETYARSVARSNRSDGFEPPDIDSYVESIITDARAALAIAEYSAWLWEQSERPEVVEAVARGLEGMGDSDEWYDTPDERQLDNAAVAISNSLYALIGPRPERNDHAK